MTYSNILRIPGMITFLGFCFFSGSGQDVPDALTEITHQREKQEATFRDEKKSPLLQRDRKDFKGLSYYPVDLAYRVKGKFIRNENPVFFKMRTTTSRLPEYVKYGEIHFNLENESYILEIYQSTEIIQRPGYEDYLFIPFTDLTNGETTYEGGRYLELRTRDLEQGEVILDFNKAYNPYCSYNPKYSCPIPPQANHLPVVIPAGEKKHTGKSY